MPTLNPRRLLLSLAALALLATGGFLLAGPINPPAGPIVPTNKTLQEVFDKAGAAEPRTAINATNTPGDADSLFRIVNPGSYYLTGNITGVVGKHGIEIAASGVTLDLSGFSLTGVPGSLDGVTTTSADLANIAVVNGSVRNWGDEGLDLGTFAATNCLIQGVLASGNAGNGIAAGSGTTVLNCSASSNTGTGISTVNGCTVSNCTATSNGSGFFVNNGNTVEGCTARSNSIDGIWCSAACVIRGNTCVSNGSAGDGAGIHATGSDNRIEGNTSIAADRGIDVDAAGNIIIANTCSGNTNNWDVVAGNGILVINATVAGAVSGNSGGTSLGSFDPNANFSY